MASAAPSAVAGGVSPAFLALSRFRRRRYDECVGLCDEILGKNPYDKAVWLLKTQALTAMTFLDDGDLEEEGIADVLMDDNSTASLPRPGTSLNGPSSGAGSSSSSSSFNQSVRPVSQSGRPTSGFVRPSTQGGGRPVTQDRGGLTSRGAMESALRKTGRPGTSRPVTALGRHVRLGTASMKSAQGGPFIDVNRLDLRKYAARPPLARALMDFLLYHDHNPRKALELGAEASRLGNYECWWWKQRLGKAFYLLGLFREAEQQLKSSLRAQPCVDTMLDLGKVFLRLDQPQNALDVYTAGLDTFPGSAALLVASARTHDLLGDGAQALALYRKVLQVDPSNVEATASLGAHYFYSDQPEVSLRFYRRLLESARSGDDSLAGPELWNNLGLCCFYASQYDMTLRCFERALQAAADNDATLADIYYNVAHVAIGVGDLGLAYQCLKVAVSVCPSHGEAWNNLGVLELRKANHADAAADFAAARNGAPHAFEPCFNAALLAFRRGDFSTGYAMATKAKELYPGHPDSEELLQALRRRLA
jgi:tetratricopeptide repeat protein 8